MVIPQGNQEQEKPWYSTCKREQVVTMGNNEGVMVMSAFHKFSCQLSQAAHMQP
jgi:hypothetical protein